MGKYEKYRDFEFGHQVRNHNVVFNHNLQKFAECYKKSNQNLALAMQVYRELFPSHKKPYITKLAIQFTQDLANEGNYQELLRIFNLNYQIALEIEKDKMYETGETENLMYVMSEWQKSLNMRKPQAINVNSNNTINQHNNIQINHQHRLTDLPIEIQQALQTIAKHEPKQLTQQKQEIDMFLTQPDNTQDTVNSNNNPQETLQET